MTEENDLIKRFEGIFIAHYPAVKGFIAALLKSEAYAEDLAQDIFARLWTRHDIWAERDGGHSGYIYAMARNAALDFLTLAMIHPTCLHLCTKLLSKARKGDAIHPEKSALFTIY